MVALYQKDAPSISRVLDVCQVGAARSSRSPLGGGLPRSPAPAAAAQWRGSACWAAGSPNPRMRVALASAGPQGADGGAGRHTHALLHRAGGAGGTPRVPQPREVAGGPVHGQGHAVHAGARPGHALPAACHPHGAGPRRRCCASARHAARTLQATVTFLEGKLRESEGGGVVAPQPNAGAVASARRVLVSMDALSSFLRVLASNAALLPADTLQQFKVVQGAAVQAHPELQEVVAEGGGMEAFAPDIEEEANTYFQKARGRAARAGLEPRPPSMQGAGAGRPAPPAGPVTPPQAALPICAGLCRGAERGAAGGRAARLPELDSGAGAGGLCLHGAQPV